MATHTEAAVDHQPPKSDSSHGSEPVRPNLPERHRKKKKKSGFLNFVIFALVVGVALGGAYFGLGKEKFMSIAHQVFEYAKEQVVGRPEAPIHAVLAPDKPKGPWNGKIKVTSDEQKAIGFRMCTVKAQTEPIRLELNGKTDYDQNTLNKVRPRFDNALVEKVFVSAGQTIKKGEPLLELRSAELGLAKNECRTNFVQWDHDRKYLMAREPLHINGQITNIVWTDTVNDEKKSRLTYFVSREKLATYGMTSEQIDKLLEGLGDDKKKAEEGDDNTQDITRITVLSPIDGVVVERDAVPGNFYDQINIMLTISPMTDLWVWGSVFESDQDKVHIGQKWEIRPQFSDTPFEARVESISNSVDADTRSLRIRATISNRDRHLVSGMLVRAILQIPPTDGDTVIPRNCLAVINGEYYAFVSTHEGENENEPTEFERRKLSIEQENTDEVVVKKGLKAGERVVSNGSLILSQLFEDQATVDSGLPVQ